MPTLSYMGISRLRKRRLRPRIATHALASEDTGNGEQHGFIIDMSEGGLRLVRRGVCRGRRMVQVEFELPGTDDIVWAAGEVCFERVDILPRDPMSTLSGTVTTSGVRILHAADSHRDMLRNYVDFMRNERGLIDDTAWFAGAG